MDVLRAFFKYFFFLIILPPLVYMLAVLIGAIIPFNSENKNKEPFTVIYLVSNGMHTDIVLPVKTDIMNWNQVVKTTHSLSSPTAPQYISFGWGDLEFYRNTPQWSDLNLKTGFRALFMKTPSAVHVRFLDSISLSQNTRSIVVDKQQYEKLSTYIIESFQYDNTGRSLPVHGLHYTRDDAFYKAEGSLHLFKTCNTWVNTGLKVSGLKACLWTPFVEGIFLRYPKIEENINSTAALFINLPKKEQP